MCAIIHISFDSFFRQCVLIQCRHDVHISYILLFDQQAIELKDKHLPRSGWGTRLDQKCAQTCSALWQMMMTTWIKIRYASFLIYLSRTFARKQLTVGVKLRGTLGAPSWKYIACSAGGRKSLTGSRFTMILVRKSRWANWWWVGDKKSMTKGGIWHINIYQHISTMWLWVKAKSSLVVLLFTAYRPWWQHAWAPGSLPGWTVTVIVSDCPASSPNVYSDETSNQLMNVDDWVKNGEAQPISLHFC